MIDLNGVEAIQITWSNNKVLWVNVDGMCKLRVQNFKDLQVNGVDMFAVTKMIEDMKE